MTVLPTLSMLDKTSTLIDLAALTAWMPRVDPGKSLRRRPANQGETTSTDDGIVLLFGAMRKELSINHCILRGQERRSWEPVIESLIGAFRY